VKTTAALAITVFTSFYVSGGVVANSPADMNLFAIRTQRSGSVETVFIVDEDGDVYYNGALQSYDDYDDALVCRDVKTVLTNGMDTVLFKRKELIKMGIISEGGFISQKRMTALILGAITQLYDENQKLKRRIYDN